MSDHHAIVPRRVSFDWDGTPLHWIPDEPTATHVINVLHLLLPAGERWFVKVFKEGLPLVTDPVLLTDVKGFMGQEATHSVQHAHVLDHLTAQRLETADYLWIWGSTYLIRHDPRLAGQLRLSLGQYNRAVGRGLLPAWRELGAAVPRYLRRSYHPSQEGSLRKAVAYLAQSPAARAAAAVAARAAIAQRYGASGRS
ncbi:metal-dependent hydrolase [Streptomyces aureocirculatus]|uniref:metal-dependent hydrolase n=1 Tax=Streptomyces aureocirculatus TaxID=67275 RepID=UPI0004CA0A4F|nr:metal-dependent hydrolase [Streptomyces aureocirculatus]